MRWHWTQNKNPNVHSCKVSIFIDGQFQICSKFTFASVMYTSSGSTGTDAQYLLEKLQLSSRSFFQSFTANAKSFGKWFRNTTTVGAYIESLIKEMEKLYFTNRNKPQAPIHSALYLQHPKLSPGQSETTAKPILQPIKLKCSQRSAFTDPDLHSPPSPHSGEVSFDAPKVEEGVYVVEPGPGFSLLVAHWMRDCVLLPAQPVHRIVSATKHTATCQTLDSASQSAAYFTNASVKLR